MNKADLVERVAIKLSMPKIHATRVVEAVLESIAEGIQQDERVSISGFGAFTKRDRAARIGVNPMTQERVEIKPQTTCVFRAAPALKAALNEHDAPD
ncbi:MAG: HU family DNA-binding protein [Planctomycetota bacterium]